MSDPLLQYLPFAVVGVSVLAALAVFLWLRRREAERREAFAGLAASLGFSWAEEDDSLLSSDLAGLHLMRQGRRRRVRNVLRRSRAGAETVCFDYQYTTSSGKNSQTHRQSVVALHLPGRAFPSFELRPEHLLHKLGSAFGYRDIDFDSSPEFSRRYLLRGEDETAIRALFGPSVLHALEQQPGWAVEATGDWLIVYRPRKRARADDLPTFLEEGRAITRVLTGE